jgi:hypothetical protein
VSRKKKLMTVLRIAGLFSFSYVMALLMEKHDYRMLAAVIVILVLTLWNDLLLTTVDRLRIRIGQQTLISDQWEQLAKDWKHECLKRHGDIVDVPKDRVM